MCVFVYVEALNLLKPYAYNYYFLVRYDKILHVSHAEDLAAGEISLYRGSSKMPDIIIVEESSSLFMPCCC